MAGARGHCSYIPPHLTIWTLDTVMMAVMSHRMRTLPKNNHVSGLDPVHHSGKRLPGSVTALKSLQKLYSRLHILRLDLISKDMLFSLNGLVTLVGKQHVFRFWGGQQVESTSKLYVPIGRDRGRCGEHTLRDYPKSGTIFSILELTQYFKSQTGFEAQLLQ